LERMSLKYRAFLSYAHADANWGAWLHRALERYRIDSDLVGRESAAGRVPKTLSPVFRDRDDFAGGQTLTDATVAALDLSAALVVVCSPIAATRPAVNEEVRLFRWRHPDRPVIPVLIGGGFPESYPPALRHELNPDGSITDRPITLLGPDLRETGDGKSLGLSKIVAGLTGVATDEIVRRAERERRRRQRNWMAGLSTVAVALTGLSIWAEFNRRDAVVQRGVAEQQTRTAEDQKRIAEQERDQAFIAQSRFLADSAHKLTENHDPVTAALVALEGLPDEPSGRRRPYVSDAELALYKGFVATHELMIFSGHDGRVFHAAVSPDGTKLATASEDATARVFEISTGRTITVLKGHTHRVVDVDFTPDGSKVVTASLDNTARLWDAATGALIQTFEGHTFEIRRAHLDRTGTRLVTASGDNTARIWDIATGETLQVFKGHADTIDEAGFSPDGASVVTASTDHTAGLWDTKSGEMKLQIGGHRFGVAGAEFSPDGKFIVTRSVDTTARIIDAATGDLVADLIGHAAYVVVAHFNPDSTRLVTADDKGEVRLWSVPDGRPLFHLQGHQRRVSDARFSPSGDLLATASDDGTIRIWDMKTGAERETLAGHQGHVLSVTFIGEDRVVSTGADTSARLWSLAPRNISELRGHVGRVFTAVYSRDGKLLITGSDDRTARIWDAASGMSRAVLGPHSSSVHGVAFSADAKLAFVGDANFVRVWDVARGIKVDEWEAFPTENNITPQISLIVLHPDGKRLAVAGNLTVNIFEIATKRLLTTFDTKEFLIQDVAFLGDGETVVTAGFGPPVNADGSVAMGMVGTARLWQTETGKQLSVIDRQMGQVAAWPSPTQSELLTVSEEGWLRRRTVTDGQVSASALVKGAQTATQSPDGTLIAISRFHGPTLIRRGLNDGDVATTASARSDIWRRAAFDPTGARFITVHEDGVARIWPAFAATERLMSTVTNQVQRCLTPDQRRAAFLPDVPPDDCIDKGLWPYGSNDWKEWRRRTLAGNNPALPSARGRLGLTGATLTPKIASDNGLTFTPGAIIDGIFESHAADRAGIKEGDIIVKVGDRDVASMEELASEVSWTGEGKTVAIGLVRDGMPMTVVARLDAYVDPVQAEGGATGGQGTNQPMMDRWREKVFNRNNREDEAKRIMALNNASLADANQGDFKKALRERELMLSLLTNVRNDEPTLGQRDAQEVAEAALFSDLAWFSVLAGQKDRALREAMKAKELGRNARSPQLNIAHALLVNDHIEEARAIYLSHRGEILEDGKSWEESVIGDFAEMKKYGIVHLMIPSLITELSQPMKETKAP